MMAAAAIMLYIELPRVIMQAQRAKEQTLIDRGEQYKRAIQLYVRKEKKYPQSIDDLETSTNTRYLRRRYKDPFTGKDDWRLIHIDVTGVYTDSLVHKAPDPNEKKEKAQTFVAEMPSLGNPDAGTDPNAPQNAGLQRRASDRPAAVAGAQPVEYNQEPGAPPPPDQFQQNPGQPGPQFPGQAYPGQAIAGQPGTLPGGFAQPFPGQPGVIPPGQPGAFPYQNPQPGQQPFGSPPVPGTPPFPYPGQPGALPSGVPLAPGQSTFPYLPQPQQQQSAPSFIGGSVTPSPTPFGQSSQPAFQFPGARQPGVASSQTGGAVQSPFPGGGMSPGSPGVPGGTSNQAVDMIQRILTTPRQAPPGVGQGAPAGIAGGIAGVASKREGEGIKIYKERTLYKEWEFLYDMREDKSGQMAAAMGQAGAGAGQVPGQANPLGSAPAGASPFGGQPGASPFGAQPGGFGQPGAGSPFGQPGASPFGAAGGSSQPAPSSSAPAPFIGGAPTPPPQQQQPQRPTPQPAQPARPAGPGPR
jgi:type II secretory pathway pseudopilin PulG